MLLVTLSACTGGGEVTDTVGESNTDLPPNENVVIFTKDQSTDYKIIYADGSSSAEVITPAEGLAYNIERTYKIGVMEVTAEFADWGIDEKDHEILIGNTTRNASKEAAKLLEGVSSGFAIKLFDNGQIAIVATNSTSLKEGIYYFMNEYVLAEENANSLALPKDFSYVGETETSGSQWKLRAPEYEGGTLARKIYTTGLSGNFNGSATGKMQVISGTNSTEFNAYITRLKAAGYTEIASNKIGNNLYYQFKNENKLCYTYYIDKFKEVRVIDDYLSAPEDVFEYKYTPKAGETAAIYQYGMMYDDNGTGGTITTSKPYENNGAFYIIRLSDNSLILIDGGRPNQATEAATEGLMDFLYEITGVDKNGTEKIRIAALFFSHGDGDHLFFVYRLLQNKKYTDRLQIERIMHNFPDSSVAGTSGDFKTLGTMLYNTYPNIRSVKLHTGQKIQLADAQFEILYTHEDMVDATSGSAKVTKNANLLSTMFKLTLNGKTFLGMGDWGYTLNEPDEAKAAFQLCEDRFLGMYEESNGQYPHLECDILQVAHHAINSGNENVHAAVKADYAFFAQQDIAYSDMAHLCYTDIVDQLRAAGMEDKHMYASILTVPAKGATLAALVTDSARGDTIIMLSNAVAPNVDKCQVASLFALLVSEPIFVSNSKDLS